MRASYSSSVVGVEKLAPEVRKEMANLYLSCYDGSSEALFLSDLATKDEVVLVHSGIRIVGFSTLRYFDIDHRGSARRIVYSGDTVVHPDHWGQQALAFRWIQRMGQVSRQAPGTPLYWLLLVKGHRTFRYLPVFSRSFYPHWEADRTDLGLLADHLARSLFANDYNPATGIVEFPVSRGHLKPNLAWPSPAEMERQGVQFFLERNPGFVRGHELVCLCEIEERNLKPLARRLFLERDHAV